MQLVRGLHNLLPLTQGCVATIGNFDGVHRGHQAILARLRERSIELGVPSCVVIFEPQPREFFAPDTAPARLTRLREKLELLAAQGVDRVLCLAFNRRLRELSADEFVRQVLVEGLRIKHLEVGDDFRFGAGRSGDFDFLVQAGVLIHAHAHPRLIEETTTQALMDALGSIGWFDADTVRALHEAHSALLARALACTLDGRSRLVSHDVWLVEAREVIAAAWQARLPAAPLS